MGGCQWWLAAWAPGGGGGGSCTRVGTPCAWGGLSGTVARAPQTRRHGVCHAPGPPGYDCRLPAPPVACVDGWVVGAAIKAWEVLGVTWCTRGVRAARQRLCWWSVDVSWWPLQNAQSRGVRPQHHNTVQLLPAPPGVRSEVRGAAVLFELRLSLHPRCARKLGVWWIGGVSTVLPHSRHRRRMTAALGRRRHHSTSVCTLVVCLLPATNLAPAAVVGYQSATPAGQRRHRMTHARGQLSSHARLPTRTGRAGRTRPPQALPGSERVPQ